MSEQESEILYTQKGTVRKRKPKQKIYYFTADTEAAILEYLASSDPVERNKIYNDRIEHAFFKLTQNIIHTFKFYYTEVDTIEELQHEVTVFLLEKLGKFNPEKGKAYSYFGTIAKRYLILYNNTNYKKLKNKASLEDVDTDKTLLINMDSASNEDTKLSKFLDKFVKEIDSKIYDLFPKEKDLVVAGAILELFKNRVALEVLSKKSIYIYIRELTDSPTPTVTKVIKRMKELYKGMLSEYLERGDYELEN
jgi:hypothetical protein